MAHIADDIVSYEHVSFPYDSFPYDPETGAAVTDLCP